MDDSNELLGSGVAIFGQSNENGLFSAAASGNGLWSMKAGTLVTFHKMELIVTVWEDDIKTKWAEIQIFHDADSRKYGLCYTDDGIENAIEAFVLEHPVLGTLVKDVSGSEQGMQMHTMFSGDVTLVKEFTLNELEEKGFTVERD